MGLARHARDHRQGLAIATRRSGYFKTDYAADLALFDTPYRKAAVLVLIGGVLLLPLAAGQQLQHVVTLTMISIIGALALNLLTGLAGQLSLGHAAFLALGGYASHYLATLGLPFPVVLVAVMAFGAALGLVVGTPALRLRGLYLVLATVGFHYIAIFAVHYYQASGEKSILALSGFLLPAPDLGLVRLDSTRRWYYFVATMLLATTAFSINLARTRVGRAWVALRERDITAAALGVHLAVYKLKAFVTSAALTCMSGSVLVFYLGSVSAEYYTIDLAVSYLAMVVIGGAGSVLGALLGGTFVAVMPFAITWLFTLFEASPRVQLQLLAPSQTIVFGMAMIGFLVFEPRGLVGIWRRARVYCELWPLSKSVLAVRRD